MESPYSVALDTTSVYWGGVEKQALDGGTVATMATVPNTLAYGIAVDATSVYWVTQDNGSTGIGLVLKVPMAGGTVTTLSAAVGNPSGVAVDSSHVYWSDSGGGSHPAIFSVPIDGGTVSTLSSQGPAWSLATDSTNVYYLSNGGVLRVPVSGGVPITISPYSQSGPGGIAVDSTSVYVAGGPVTPLIQKITPK